MNQLVELALSCRLDISDKFPKNFPGSRISDEESATYHFSSGYLNLQVTKLENYTIYYFVLSTEKPITYKFYPQVNQYSSVFQLTGEMVIKPNTNTNIKLQEGHWQHLTDISQLEVELTESKNLQYFFISYEKQPINEMENIFNLSSERIFNQKKFQLKNALYPLEIKAHLKQVLSCKYDGELRKHFFEHRMGDILFTTYVHFSGVNPFKSIHPDDLEKIYTAEKIITNNITKNWTLQVLAEEIGMSLTKFKELFKKVYHQTPSDYQRRLRLELAVHYLENGCSVKEAAYKVGWRPVVFIEAFRQEYQTTPGNYIRRKK